MKRVRLDAAFSAIVDCEHKTAPENDAGDFFAVGTPAMVDNRINYSSARRIDQATFTLWTKRMRPIFGDLLFAREAPVGPVVRIPETENVAPGQRTVLLRPDPEKIDPVFAFFALTSPEVQARIHDRSTGSTVAHLNVADIRAFEISLPALVDQRAIAEVLSALDDKIAANQRTAHASWALSAALYSQVSRNAGGSVLLGDLVATQYGLTTPATGGPAQLLRVTDINKRPWITWESVPFCDPSPADMIRYKLAPGDIVVARMADPGKSAWISSDPLEAVFASYLVRLKVHDPTQSAFVYHFLQSQAYLDYVQFSKQGSVQSNMNAKVIVNCPMPDPGKVDLKTFNEKASLLRQTIDISLAEASRLEALRDTLLPALMSGKLHVKDAERAVEDVL